MTTVELAKELLRKEIAQPRRTNYDAYQKELPGIFQALIDAELVIKECSTYNGHECPIKDDGTTDIIERGESAKAWLETHGSKNG